MVHSNKHRLYAIPTEQMYWPFKRNHKNWFNNCQKIIIVFVNLVDDRTFFYSYLARLSIGHFAMVASLVYNYYCSNGKKVHGTRTIITVPTIDRAHHFKLRSFVMLCSRWPKKPTSERIKIIIIWRLETIL